MSRGHAETDVQAGGRGGEGGGEGPRHREPCCHQLQEAAADTHSGEGLLSIVGLAWGAVMGSRKTG